MTFEKQFSKLFHAFSSWLLLKIWSRIFSVMFQTNMFWQPHSWALCITLSFPVRCGLECNTQLMRCTKVGGLARSRQYKDPRYKEHFAGVQQGGCQREGPLLWKEFVGDGGTACAWSDFVSLTVGWACRRRLSPACAKGWMLNQILCTSPGSNFSHQGGLPYRWDDGILLNIHPCLKCDNTQLSRRAVCGLGACGWDMRCLLYLFCSRDSCVLGNVCGKVRAIAIGILKIEA